MAAYEWPLLPIADPEQAAKRMGAAMDSAWQDLEDERLHVIETARVGRKREVNAALREFQAAIERFGLDVATHLERFASLHLAPQYISGVQQGGGLPVWTAIHTQAFTALALDTYADFLQRSEDARQTSRAFATAVRDASAEELPKIAGRGLTARQGGRRLEGRLLADYDITHVTYRDGSRVTVRTYSEMVARTKSAVAYNSGTLGEGRAQGVGYYEVFDGPSCGWTGHGDADKASGSVRAADECAIYMLAHPNCVAAGTRVTPIGSLQAGYRAAYEGPMVALTTARNHRATVTPNHPVLTGRGWLPASSVRVGDQVLSEPVADLSRGGPDLDGDDVPPRIEEVYDALRPAGSSSRRVATGADFHGDAAFFDGYVDVVGALGSLGNVGDVGRVEQGGEAQFVTGGSEGAGSGAGAGSESLGRVDLPTPRGPGRGHVPGVEVRRADPDASLSQPIPDDAVADSDLGRKVSRRLTSEVSQDPVVEVRHVDAWSGHVYDLSTEGAAYVADGIVVHNCQRAFGPRPDIKDDDAARKANPTTTEEQRADAADVEKTREAMTNRPRARARARRRAARESA